MKNYTIKKERMSEFIHHLLQNYTVWGPGKDGDALIYKKISSPQEIILDFLKVKTPLKTIVFPQTETLVRFCKENNTVFETQSPPKKNTVIFGVRPCDAKSLQLLDTVFLDDYKDPFYYKKRNTTITIGLTCISPPGTCFCSSVGGNPDDPTELDILLTNLNDKYYMEIITEKGEKLLKEFKGISPADEQDTQKKNKICLQARKRLIRKVSVKNIDTILDAIFDSPYWETIAQRCIGCGICTFLCPTCHCFDIQDETSQNKGARVRIWDSCMYPEYSCQASGYNPRATQMNRVRNRIYHKFNYLLKNNQILGCVGCGRCIDDCPVHIDIIEIITNAREVKP
jgi:sulfhydrogenase subunit beta (sulfur reductase)